MTGVDHTLARATSAERGITTDYFSHVMLLHYYFPCDHVSTRRRASGVNIGLVYMYYNVFRTLSDFKTFTQVPTTYGPSDLGDIVQCEPIEPPMLVSFGSFTYASLSADVARTIGPD